MKNLLGLTGFILGSNQPQLPGLPQRVVLAVGGAFGAVARVVAFLAERGEFGHLPLFSVIAGRPAGIRFNPLMGIRSFLTFLNDTKTPPSIETC